MNKEIKTDKAPRAIGPYSQAIKSGNTIYVSGQLGINPNSGNFDDETIETQTTQSLESIKAILNAEGYEMSDVVKTTVLLQDMNDFSKMNEIYAKYFSEPYPARAAFEVVKLPKGGRVEIECIAEK